MSGTGECVADFAGEERAFRIRLGEIRRIEAACGAGIGEILRRLARGAQLVRRISDEPGGLTMLDALAGGIEIRADDVRETVRQGLLGARVLPANEVDPLVRREIDDRGVPGLLDYIGTALVVLLAARNTPEADDPGERVAGAAAAVTPPSPMTSQTSTASPPPPSA